MTTLVEILYLGTRVGWATTHEAVLRSHLHHVRQHGRGVHLRGPRGALQALGAVEMDGRWVWCERGVNVACEVSP